MAKRPRPAPSIVLGPIQVRLSDRLGKRVERRVSLTRFSADNSMSSMEDSWCCSSIGCNLDGFARRSFCKFWRERLICSIVESPSLCSLMMVSMEE